MKARMKPLFFAAAWMVMALQVGVGARPPVEPQSEPGAPPEAPAAPEAGGQRAAPVAPFKVRKGYEVTLAADKLGNARFMEFDDKGRLYLSRPNLGDILVLSEPDADGVYQKRATFVQGKTTVHGLCWADGWMWFTTSGAVFKARDNDGDGKAEEVQTVLKDLPEGGHWWRPILVGEDFFITGIGDSGNITDETDSDRQKHWKYSLDGVRRTLFVSGIRNTEKLRVRPGTTEIWGFDHGSDNFGERLGERAGSMQPTTDLNPPDELNLYVEGGFYGHPFIVGDKLPRYEYKDRKDIVELAKRAIAPEWKMGAHWACNGWCFIDPRVNQRTHALPDDHEGDIFVASHGSWNSQKKVGYAVSRVLFDKESGKPYGLLKIVSTLNAEGTRPLARPVDCVQAPDGSVLWSCDITNRIYRIRAVK